MCVCVRASVRVRVRVCACVCGLPLISNFRVTLGMETKGTRFE